MPALRWHSVHVRTIRSVSGTRERETPDARAARANHTQTFLCDLFLLALCGCDLALHTHVNIRKGKTRTRR